MERCSSSALSLRLLQHFRCVKTDLVRQEFWLFRLSLGSRQDSFDSSDTFEEHLRIHLPINAELGIGIG